MTEHNSKQSLVLAGGLTAGPVMPLLALAEAWRAEQSHKTVWLFDVSGSVGQRLNKTEQLQFQNIVAGKFRRYLSVATLLAPFLVVIGFVQALYYLSYIKPVAVLGAGGFVQVPVMYAAWLLGIPRMIHQQDVTPTLANSLCAPIANRITVTFEVSRKDFLQSTGLFGYEKNKIEVTGNPIRTSISHGSKEEALKYFNLDPSWPTVLIIGGGSGAMGINKLVAEGLTDLTRVAQIIHSTGTGKQTTQSAERYHPYEFIDRMDLAYAAADIVIARAGIGTITELSNLGKVSIIIPMPGTHQEANASLLYSAKAAVVFDQREVEPPDLAEAVRILLFAPDKQKIMQQNIKTLMLHNATQHVLACLNKIVRQ